MSERDAQITESVQITESAETEFYSFLRCKEWEDMAQSEKERIELKIQEDGEFWYRRDFKPLESKKLHI